MKRKVSATRQELFRLRRRLALATRGHKLLKDKLEALVKEVAPLVNRYAEQTRRIEDEVLRLLTRFALASASSGGQAIQRAVFQNEPVPLTREKKWYMGVRLPKLTIPEKRGRLSYSYVQTGPELDEAILEGYDFLPLLLELAEVQQALFLLSRELERTRRRSNALEHVLIPELAENRKSVEQKLAEMERSDISRLMKIKEMITEAESRAAS